MEKSKKSELQERKSSGTKGKTEELCISFANKIKFPLWLLPATMESVDELYIGDNCKSKSEFIEKAINFYIGFLKSEDNVNYLSPRITSSVDAVVHGAEQTVKDTSTEGRNSYELTDAPKGKTVFTIENGSVYPDGQMGVSKYALCDAYGNLTVTVLQRNQEQKGIVEITIVRSLM